MAVERFRGDTSMSPLVLLGIAVGTTTAAALWDVTQRRRRGRQLRALASEWRMTYSPADALRLTDRIARQFPIPGAADVRVRDVIYGSDRDRYRYVFTVEFTTGVIRTKHRNVRVAAFSEPRTRDPQRERLHSIIAPVILASGDSSLWEQYRQLAPTAAAAISPQPATSDIEHTAS